MEGICASQAKAFKGDLPFLNSSSVQVGFVLICPAFLLVQRETIASHRHQRTIHKLHVKSSLTMSRHSDWGVHKKSPMLISVIKKIIIQSIFLKKLQYSEYGWVVHFFPVAFLCLFRWLLFKATYSSCFLVWPYPKKKETSARQLISGKKIGWKQFWRLARQMRDSAAILPEKTMS